MNIEVRAKERTQQTKLSIVDCDFHPRLTHEQIEKLCRWLDEQAPTGKALDQLERALGETREILED